MLTRAPEADASGSRGPLCPSWSPCGRLSVPRFLPLQIGETSEISELLVRAVYSETADEIYNAALPRIIPDIRTLADYLRAQKTS